MDSYKVDDTDFDFENCDCSPSKYSEKVVSYTDTDSNIEKESETPIDANESEIGDFSAGNDSNENDSAQFLMALSTTNRILFDGSFFQLNMKKTKSSTDLVATCKKCVNGREIKGSTRATSNFRSHLKRVHGQGSLDNLTDYIQSKKMDHDGKINVHAGTSTVRKLASRSVKTKFSQEIFEADILNYVTKSFSPLSTVENPDFRAIFDHMEIPSLKHISRKKLTKHIEAAYDKNKNIIKKHLEDIEFVCTTADVWSSKHRRFIGVTCHWIDNRTLERKSAALACKRFPGTHSFDRIADLLSQVHHEYNLPLHKITGTVTDNGSNFVKAFTEFGIVAKSENYENDEISTDEIPSFEESGFLPPHIRCCSHTLSLIATVDIPNTIKMDATLKIMNEQCLKKCSSIWSLSSHPKTSEIIKETIGITLNRPVITRWNSFYDSISTILQVGEKLPLLTNRLKLQPFTNTDIKYLKEYIRCLAPLAIALDRLQGEKAVYFGYVLPSLLEVKKKCEKLIENDEITYCRPILITIISQLNTRFNQYLALDRRSHNAVIATFSLPVFKTRWLAAIDEVNRDQVRTIFMKAVKNENHFSKVYDLNRNQQQADDFYFGDDNFAETVPLTPSVELEALKYFGDSRRNLLMLEEYPIIKRLFLKYNTPLPSSAPVERLFSYATMFNIARFGCLSDDHFEERVIFIANKEASFS